MHTTISRPGTLLRVVVAVAVAGVLVAGMFAYSAHPASAVTLISTSQDDAAADAGDEDALSQLLSSSNPLSADQIQFYEQNVMMPGSAETAVLTYDGRGDIPEDVALPWSDDPGAAAY